ncbi:endo-1,4-beta-xylanase [Gilvimarinus sp. SDUM040013]|uniref:Beta-xylanase n=1 Tax=Gilvimarinus gilvus TaxID=3058038 RepID=A0ABU4RX48_9GAMM|nr:endo-1,4-beta-xylanase [Gilvimarinus sp. SDUM040013]MDO3387833.1 endo-1,4-beta-xylanase [Gilvimarinus sp. SDUM040013]MDX6848796.1 endo-1,4-beta-xylanase [Gilvimarinus sp. SDUM040013]
MIVNRRKFLLSSLCASGAIALAKQQAMAAAADVTGIANAFKDDFFVGTAISKTRMMTPPDGFHDLVAREFNAMTMENDMKWERLHPEPDTYHWDIADTFVDFCEQHGMFAVGHVLVWHSQTPRWVFNHPDGTPLSRSDLLARMKNHIDTVAGRYKGRIQAWDVVNEAIDEDKGWRKSPWFNQIGADFVDHAFQYARAAAPEAHLLYNDYNMHNPGKRQFVVEMVERFKKNGTPIDGIGMQGHIGLGYPDIQEFEKSIEAYAATGCAVHITELDLDVLPVAWEHMGAEISDNFAYSDELNPYAEGLPDDVQQQLTERYVEWFKLFLKHRNKIARVTFWGTGDGESWKNGFPVRGRTNYPLLFDRDYQRKPAYDAVTSLKK